LWSGESTGEGDMTGAGIRDRQTAGMRLTERNREFIPAKKVQRTSKGTRVM